MESETKKLNSEIEKNLAIIDQKWLRPLQRKMYLCSAKCCEDSTASTERVNSCLKNCSNDFQESFNFTQEAILHIQTQVRRCSQTCYDEAMLGINDKSSQAEVDKANEKLETCVVKCVRESSLVIPSLMKKIQDFMERKIEENGKNN